MAEWLKARAWKVRLPERVTGVRIPLSPPLQIGGGAAASSATAASEACFGEPTMQMMQGPKGRRSAMKPSLTGKADEGGQSLSLHSSEPSRRRPGLLVRAESAFSRRSEGPTPWNEALPQRERPMKEANPVDSRSFGRACSSEQTAQMNQGPKGRRSAMKPSPTGKADEGGQNPRNKAGHSLIGNAPNGGQLPPLPKALVTDAANVRC